MKQVEFESWDTSLNEGELHLIDLHWGDGAIDVIMANGDIFKEKANPLFKNIELQLRVINLITGGLYKVNFSEVNGYRLLDEHGLLQIWEERDKQNFPILNTFKVKNHMWAQESPITFIFGHPKEWSHIITTSNECLEVVCGATPTLEFIKFIANKKKQV